MPKRTEKHGDGLFASTGSSSTRGWLFSWGAIFIVAIGLNAHPVPYGNEYLYLLAPYRWAHPAMLRGDWSFATVFDIHRVFNAVFGIGTLFVSLETLGIVCRLASWGVLTWLILRLACRFGLGPGLATLSVVIWLITQSLYGGEWIFGGFEAKVVAYICVFAGLDRLLDRHDRAAALLFGLAFTWHSSVGLAAGVGAAVAFLASGLSVRRLTIDVAIALAAMVPGLIAIVPALAGGGGADPALWRTQVTVITPEHMDVATFGNSPIVLSFSMLLFNLSHSWALRRYPAFRQLASFQLGVSVVTAAGILAWAGGAYSLLKIYPFRVFPVLVPLFFLFHLSRVYKDYAQRQPTGFTALLAFFSLLLYPNPLVQLRSRFGNLRSEWRSVSQPDDLATLFRWIGQNTPESSVIVSPPWRRESFYLTRRSQIGLRSAVSYAHLADWTSRVEMLVGPLDSLAGADVDAWDRQYAKLDVAQLGLIRKRFGADFYVGRVQRNSLTLPMVARQGTHAVYDLRGLPR